MPYGNKARSVRAYTYGCGTPIAGWDDARDQHRRRVTLWNALVELDRKRRERREAIVAAYVTGDTDEERRASRRAAFAREDVKAALAALDRETYEATKPLYAKENSGLYWGNYLDVIRAWQTACKQLDAPRFHRYDPTDGKISIRWPTGIPVSKAWGDDTQLQIDPLPADLWTGGKRPGRPQYRTMMRIRVRTEGRRTPVWLELPLKLHRPLPADGIIREVHVTWQRIAGQLRWQASFVIEVPEQTPVPAGTGRVAVDLCWRKRPDGSLRIAYWLDDQGHEGELCLPKSWLVGVPKGGPERSQAGIAKVVELQSLRDQHFNAAKAALGAWLATAPGVPAWLREQTATLSQWRSPGRLAAVVLRWRNERFAGDDAGYTLAQEWRKRDRHLWEYEANLRDHLLTERREIYRRFAAWLARTYREVVIEDVDLRQLASGLARNDQYPPARYQRQIANVASLRQAIVNACEREGVTVTRVASAYTSVTCHRCGSVEQWDKAAELEHTCSQCGVRWDQDANACRNLLNGGVREPERAVATA